MALLRHPEVDDLERQNCSPFLSKTSVRRTCDLHARQTSSFSSRIWHETSGREHVAATETTKLAATLSSEARDGVDDALNAVPIGNCH